MCIFANSGFKEPERFSGEFGCAVKDLMNTILDNLAMTKIELISICVFYIWNIHTLVPP